LVGFQIPLIGGIAQISVDFGYHCRMFNLGSPKTGGDWVVHIAGAFVALFLVWWMLRMFVL
jgi:hypothetical protein